MSVRETVMQAQRSRTAVVAFNVIGLEHAEAVVLGAEQAGRPVILQFSANAIRFRLGRVAPLAAACAALARTATVPVALHLDHAESLDDCRAAAAAGVGSVMYDGADLPFEENVAATSAVTAWAARNDVWVEAELGEIGGKEGAHAGAHTDPDKAAEFVRRTGVGMLAVAVGSEHKMASASATLDLDRIAAIAAATSVPLVLHGSSGVDPASLAEGVRRGIAKVNVGTRIMTAFTAALRASLDADPGEVDARAALAAGREAATVAVRATLDGLPS